MKMDPKNTHPVIFELLLKIMQDYHSDDMNVMQLSEEKESQTSPTGMDIIIPLTESSKTLVVKSKTSECITLIQICANCDFSDIEILHFPSTVTNFLGALSKKGDVTTLGIQWVNNNRRPELWATIQHSE